MNSGFKNNRGFSLIELLIYLAVFAMSASLMVSALSVFLKVGQRESAGSEVSSQLNFVMQTIQRLVKESSNIDIAADTATSTLKLRMKNQANDPTCISLVDGIIRLAEGPAENPNECNSNFSTLTSDRIIVDNLEFTKLSQYPGHDVVSVDIQMTYDSQNPESREQRTLRSAIARVSAATFDSDLLPGADNQYEVGFSLNKRWKNISISNLLNLGQSAGEPVGGQNGSIYYNSTENKFKGYQDGQWGDLGGGGAWQALGDNIYNSNIGGVGIGTDNPLGPFHIATASSSNALVVDALGKVGIGTSTPIRTLHLYSPSISSEIIMEVADSPVDYRKWNLGAGWGAPSGRKDFFIRQLNDAGDGGDVRLFIDGETGNIAIGGTTANTAPNSTLDILGNLSVSVNVGIGIATSTLRTKLYVASLDPSSLNIDPLNNENNLVSIVYDDLYDYPDNLLKIVSDPGGYIFGGPIYALTVKPNGKVGIGTNNPSPNASAMLDVALGDIAVSNPGSGIILKTPNGLDCYRIAVDNAGVLSTTATTCP